LIKIKEMPRKNKEELAAETTSTEETTVENTVEASADNDSANVEATPEAKTETEEAAEPSFIESIAETVGAAVGSAAATLTGGISSVVSAITGDSSTTESDKSHHNKRAERIGIVQSDKMTKTVTVRVERQVKHPIYRKYIKRRKNFMAHDEKGAAIGDKVRIVETRPLSAKKRWRVVEIIQKAVK
jgi:small subunit ribosomal protein S17